MPVSVSTVTQNMNYFFTMYFLMEMLIKITGLGPRTYVKDGYNVFDCIVTVASLTDMIIALAPNVTSPGVLSVFRCFRLLRVFRLARSWKSLSRIIGVLITSLQSVGWLIVLLGLYLFITALAGMTVR